MGRRAKQSPAHYVAEGGAWPDGPFVSEAPVYVTRIAQMVRRLVQHAASQQWSQRTLAQQGGVTVNTINYLYQGKVIPDTATLATLEASLGVVLWGKSD